MRVIDSGIILSGCRESNPGYMHPMHAYCHYTTPRFLLAASAYFLLLWSVLRHWTQMSFLTPLTFAH